MWLPAAGRYHSGALCGWDVPPASGRTLAPTPDGISGSSDPPPRRKHNGSIPIRRLDDEPCMDRQEPYGRRGRLGIYVARLPARASQLGAFHARIVLCRTRYAGTVPTEKLAVCSGELYFVRR